MTPSPCERRLSVSTRAGVPSTMRRSIVDDAALRVALHDLGDARRCATDAAGAVHRLPVRTGSRNVSRMART